MANHQTNLAWDTLLDLGEPGSGPMHARLVRAVREAIRDGRLPAGAGLPPTRDLAVELGCSRWVVTEAYEQLVAEGYLESRVGSGTRVRRVGDAGEIGGAAGRGERPAATDEQTTLEEPTFRQPPIDLAPGLPDLRHFPASAWLSAYRLAATSLPYPELSYPEPAGHVRLRAMLAAYLVRVRGAAAMPADLTVTSGVTDGVTRICRALAGRGVAAIAVEDPGWGRLAAAARVAGMAALPVRVDAEGLDVAALESAGPEVRGVVVSPAHQFPTGTVLAPGRRAALLEWARRRDGLVIEDDYDAEFRYDRRPVATLHGSDPDRVALLGSLSKTLSPALGIGWMATPAWLTSLVRAVEVRPAAPPLLDQIAFAEFLASGGYDRHMRAARKRYRARRDGLVAELGRRLPLLRVSGAAAGLHLLAHVPPGTDTRLVAARADRLGLHIATIEQYRVDRENAAPALVLGYGNLGDGEVIRAVELLARAVAG